MYIDKQAMKIDVEVKPMSSQTKMDVRRALGVWALVILMAGIAAPGAAYADTTSADKQAEARATMASLTAMQGELNRASDTYYVALDEAQQAQDKMQQAQDRIDGATEEVTDLQSALGNRARFMYRNGAATFLDMLMGAATFDEFATSWTLLEQLNQNDATMVQQAKTLREEIEKQKGEYSAQERTASDKAAEAKAIKDQAEETLSAMQATYDGLSAEVADLLEQERAAQQVADAARAGQVVEESAQNASVAQLSSQSANDTNASSGGTGGEASGGTGGGSGWSGPTYNPVTGNAIVDRAYGCLGLPYEWGAYGPNSFDCSGLVSYAVTGSYGRLGSTYTFMGYPQVSDPQPGDIAVNWNHCGIYIGNGQMIHAPDYGFVVTVGPVQGGMIIVRP